MERLKQRIEAAKRAWASLHELVILSKPTVVKEMQQFNDLNTLLRQAGRQQNNI